MKTKIRNIEDFQVYQKAVKLFEVFIDEDLPSLKQDFVGRTLAGNQLRCLDSICANMEEGYERKSGKEIIHFFRIAKGSTGEARGRYKRLARIIPLKIVQQRIDVLNEIRAMPEALIHKWS